MKKTASNILRTFLISVSFLFMTVAVSAQEADVPEGWHLEDSLVYRRAALVDSALVGRNIFSAMPSRSNGDKADVNVYQSAQVGAALQKHIRANASRSANGYRVRIFFDNRQTARIESENTLKRFESMYHGIPAYRTYANPYFKVTVGDFRTKSEAMSFLARIKTGFPSAFVVKESINYPVVDNANSYVVDTVKVLKPVTGNY